MGIDRKESLVRIHNIETLGRFFGVILFLLVPAKAHADQSTPQPNTQTPKPAPKPAPDKSGMTAKEQKEIDDAILQINEATAHDRYQALLDAEPTERKEYNKLIDWAKQVLSSGGSQEDNEERSRSLIAQAKERWSEYQAKISEAKAEWLKALARLKVDDCRKVYQRTIDKKTSDLTVRETELATGCRSLNLYPPATR